MITMREFLDTFNYRISEGGEYYWKCYGSNAYSISCWNGIHDNGGWSGNIVFDTLTQTVYEVEVADYTNDRAYRIINPEFKAAYYKEAGERGSSASQAWDDVNFVDLEVDDDWRTKACAIVEGREYDDRVSVEVEFSDEELFEYMKLAHAQDITFNQLVERAIKESVEEYERNPAQAKRRVKDFINAKNSVE